ncbi:MAG TPA: SIS domain-containing protein, partial [Acidimicrobiales bacterium]|nr:SIS domain-containing protein [Acidimicrobiales bacterium]
MGRFTKLVERLPALAPAESAIEYALEVLVRTYAQGGKVMVCGNGGSASDAEHIVGELMKGMSGRRPVSEAGFLAELAATAPAHADFLSRHLDEALPTFSLSSQLSLLTAVSNDISSDVVFA